MTLRVGTGRSSVTPRGPVAMSGFAARAQPSGGVADELEARALALSATQDDLTVLVSVDAIGVDRQLTRALRRRLRDLLPSGRVALSATHTHGGPALLQDAFLGPVDAATRARYLDGAESAARQAVAGLAPAELRSGATNVPGVARNRRRADGPVDEELSVVWAVDRRGEVVAALIDFALHPVVLGPDNLLLTRDYVGFTLDAFERQFTTATALFATGCAGQINHGHAASASFSGAPDPSRTFGVAQRIGQDLAAAAAAVIRGGGVVSHVAEVKWASRQVRLPLQREDTDGAAAGAATAPILEELLLALERAEAAGNTPAQRLLEEQVGWARRELGRAPRSRAAQLVAIGLGNVALLLLPGEPFVEYGLATKGAAATLYPELERVVPVGYANDAVGYLPTASALSEGGYEVELAYRFYGLPSRYASRLERHLTRATTTLLKQVIR